MKPIQTLAAVAATATALLLPLAATAKTDPAVTQAEIQAADAAYWKAYNSCDYAALDALTADDVEFYHDLGGITNGRAALTGSVRDNICGSPNLAVRRDAAPGEVQIFLLHRDGDVYGALVTGQHHFFNVVKASGAASPSGHARFTTLWVRKDQAWKISRVMSYDHQPTAYQSDRKAASLSAAALDQFVGSYAAKIQPLLVFRRDGGNLSVEVGGHPITFYPQSATSFFMKERNLVVEFKPAANGKSPGFTVLQDGAEIDEDTRQ